MTSASSLLASLTGESGIDFLTSSNDDNALNPSQEENNGIGKVEETEEEDDGGLFSTDSQTKASDFLSTSGLLTGPSSQSSTNDGNFQQESMGLFAQVDEEIERERQERLEEEQRILEKKQREEELENERKMALLALERERAEKEEQEMLRQAAIAEENRAVLQQRKDALGPMNGMQELSLNDDQNFGYRQQSVNTGPVPNGPGNTINNSYSNTREYQQNHQPKLQQAQLPQNQMDEQQQIQQAGYGGASYYYSTTGNNVQQTYSDPRNDTDGNANGPPIPNHLQAPTLPPPSPPVDVPTNSYSARSQKIRMAVESANNEYDAAMTTSSGLARQPPRYSTMPQEPASPPHQQQQPSHAVSPGINHYTVSTSMAYPNGGQVQPPQTQPMPQPQQLPPLYDPSRFKPSHGPITVTDPILVQSPGVFSGPPHWTYCINVRSVETLTNVDGEEFSPLQSNVRRRFRHFVALENRLRRECPGAILPPRPDKHATRAIDEASTRQSSQFAIQRATDLEIYLNSLRLHPIAGSSPALHLFLTLPDHIGVAWPEVSSSIFTRLTEVGTSTAVKVAEGTSTVISELSSEQQTIAGEDNHNILALASSEGLRIGSVVQAVPKILGTIAQIGELGAITSVNGLEMQKLSNLVIAQDRELGQPFETLSSGLLRSGRRTTRLAVELAAAAESFNAQYKLSRYERLAFMDRRSALARRREARKEAEKRSQKLMLQQHAMQMGRYGIAQNSQMEIAATEEFAVEAVWEADEVGRRLEFEISRIATKRYKEWSEDLNIMVANLKETFAERTAIWEGCHQIFMGELTTDLGAVVVEEEEDLQLNPQEKDQDDSAGDNGVSSVMGVAS